MRGKAEGRAVALMIDVRRRLKLGAEVLDFIPLAES